MRRVLPMLVIVVCASVTALTQSRLPASDNALIVAPPYVLQATTTPPYDMTFKSGTALVPRDDVHEFATTILRSALMGSLEIESDNRLPLITAADNTSVNSDTYPEPLRCRWFRAVP
jgi:hypothetical protein